MGSLGGKHTAPIAKFVGALLILLALGGCVVPYEGDEPPFTVGGPPAVLARAVVNIEVIRADNTSELATLLYNGQIFTVDNADAKYYRIYISYDNAVMARFFIMAASERHNGVPVNELLFHKADDLVSVSYVRTAQRRFRGMRQAFMAPLAELKPENGFYGTPEAEIEKFTAFYE